MAGATDQIGTSCSGLIQLLDPASLNLTQPNIARKPAVLGLRQALTAKIEAATKPYSQW